METTPKHEKPTNPGEFKTWLKHKFDYEIDSKYEFYYNTVIKILRTDFEKSEYWKTILNELPEINDKYYSINGVHLLTPLNAPQIHAKTLDSLLIKAFRENVLNNDLFPAPPKGGWITPGNWFDSINDIVRTTLTVKYLDGVQFIINELAKLSIDYDFSSSFEAREEGYYAAHSEIVFPFSIPDTNFSPIEKPIKIEIQVTTQIQEIIKTLLHKHYEENRQLTIPKDYKWQWDYKCPEFASNYLGHIIHYVEGMIVEIRDKEK